MDFTFEELYQLYDYCLRMKEAYAVCCDILETEYNVTEMKKFAWLSRVFEKTLDNYSTK